MSKRLRGPPVRPSADRRPITHPKFRMARLGGGEPMKQEKKGQNENKGVASEGAVVPASSMQRCSRPTGRRMNEQSPRKKKSQCARGCVFCVQ